MFIFTAIKFGTVTTTHTGENISKQATLTGLPALLLLVGVLLYFIVMEWYFAGTLGKLVMKLKVTQESATKMTFQQVIIRNLARLIDAFPYFVPYLVGITAIASSNKQQRLGDRLAKTIVMRR